MIHTALIFIINNSYYTDRHVTLHTSHASSGRNVFGSQSSRRVCMHTVHRI